MRVYVPVLPAELFALSADGSLVAPRAAFAVTTELAQWVDEAYGIDDPDDEEYEYAAMGEAARAALLLLAAEGGPNQTCRVVLAADVPDRAVSVAAEGGPGEVQLDAPLARGELVSVHVDDADSSEVVAAAAAAVRAAEDGDEAAEEIVEAADADELLWYAAAELSSLVAEPRFAR